MSGVRRAIQKSGFKLGWKSVLALSGAGLAATAALATGDRPEVHPNTGNPAGITRDRTPPQPITIPANLSEKLSSLSEEQRAFLVSGKSRRIVDEKSMFKRFDKLNNEQIGAYVDAMIALQAEVDFSPTRDLPTIPLDTSATNFNAWKLRRPAELNPTREAGPLNLNRYVGGYGGGFSTFGGAPLALTPEDLIAGSVDVAIVGAPLDMGSGWRDARNGPRALRTAMGAPSGFGLDMFSQVNPMRELKVVDYGDIAIDQLSTERSVHHVREVVAEIAATGAIPIVIGGDHSLEYPNLAGITDVHGKGNVGVIHFDSHYDIGSDRVHLIDHGAPIYRLLNEGHVRPDQYVEVGLRSRGPDKATFQWMREMGMSYHTMVEVERYGWPKVMNSALANVRKTAKKIWISFDIDVLDPAYMPGTGTPVPGGLTMREAQPIMRRLCAENDIVGIDLVEVAPYLDVSYTTALNSAHLVNACLTGIAMRKKGLTKPHWLDPVSLSSRKGA